MKLNPLITTVVVAAIVGVVGAGVGFEVRGMPQFSRFGSSAANSQGRGSRNGQNGGPGGFMNRGGAIGQVTALDDKSITVKMPDGSSKIVLISDTTTYETTTKADKSGLKTGTTVRVIGSTNSDGSITGTDVMLNPVVPTQMLNQPQGK